MANRPARLVCAVLTAALLLGSCGGAAPSPTPPESLTAAESQAAPPEGQPDLSPAVEPDLALNTLRPLPLTDREDALQSMLAGRCHYYQFYVDDSYKSFDCWVEVYRDGQLVSGVSATPDFKDLQFPSGCFSVQTSTVSSPLWSVASYSGGAGGANSHTMPFDPVFAMFGKDGMLAMSDESYWELSATMAELVLSWEPPGHNGAPQTQDAETVADGKEFVLYAEAYQRQDHDDPAFTPEEARLVWGEAGVRPGSGDPSGEKQYHLTANPDLRKSWEVLKKFDILLVAKCGFSTKTKES